jgi:RimK family alpha-L-glutamate ligase
MTIGVLAAEDSWYWRDLVRAAGTDYQLVRLSFDELSTTVRDSKESFSCGQRPLDTLDAVLVRTMPPGTLEQVVFRMDLLARLETNGVVVLNPAKAVEAAVDKYLATARLSAAGLLSPQTCCCQTAQDALEAWEQLGEDVVVKPLFGGEGRGIVRVTERPLASRAFRMLEQMGSVIYLQKFIPHEGCDLRLFVLGDDVFGMRRVGQDDWRTNISQGALAEPLEVTPPLADLARRATHTIAAPIAGVDLLPGQDGNLYVLEINAVPGWKALAGVTGIDIARRVLDYTASVVAQQRHR